MLELSCALSENERTRAILSGAVTPEGLRLNSAAVFPSEMFFRQLSNKEFDVSEMSISMLMNATAKGNHDWVGIPVFTMRRFFHTGVVIRTDRGIEKPADLAGKRVGVAEYLQTAAVWTRGVLRDEFGLQPESMEWFMERNPGRSVASAIGSTPPPGVKLSFVPQETNLGRMLVEGTLDALIVYVPARNLVDRSTIDPLTHPKVRRLFNPPGTEARRYFSKTGIYPINHCMIVRRSIAEKHPWVVLNIYNAFQQAKSTLAKKLDSLLEQYVAVGAIDADTYEHLRIDNMPYGVKSSRTVLETIARFIHEDGLSDRRIDLEEIFAKQTLDL